MILLPPPSWISIELGYATLAELGRALDRQGIRTRVAAGCAGDVYAIRAPRTDWPSLRAALLADGRLTIAKSGGAWTIGLDPANRAAERRALAQYEESVRSQLHDLYGAAERQARRWFERPEEWRAVTRESARPLTDARARLAFGLSYDARDHGDYAQAAIPAALSAPGRRLGTVWSVASAQAASLVGWGGDPLGNRYVVDAFGFMPEAQTRAKAGLARARFAGKLVWDPLTLTTGFRWGFWTPEFAHDLSSVSGLYRTWRLTPKWWGSDEPVPLLMPRTDWRPAQRGSSAAWEAEAAMPERPLFVSEAALRWARERSENLVAYVSPLGDLPLAARPRRSLESAVRDLDAGTLDRFGVADFVYAWAGEEGGTPFLTVTSLPPARRATLLRAGDYTVLRTEMRFLDGLVADDLNVPASWLNSRLGAPAPSLGEVVRRVAALHPERWRSGFFPVSWLGWCDPASFYPFAVLISDEPGLRALATVPGENWTRTIDALKFPGRFVRAVDSVAPFADDRGTLTLEPLLATRAMRDARKPCQLSVGRYGGLSCAISMVGEDDQHGINVWSTWLRLPQHGEPPPRPNGGTF